MEYVYLILGLVGILGVAGLALLAWSFYASPDINSGGDYYEW